MKIVAKYLLLSLLLIHINCKENPATATFELQAMASPAGQSSSFPYLFAGADGMWMSWVETHDSISTLNYAAFKEGSWGEAAEIHRGGDWFVNWADFPAIAENKGNLLSHVLQKSSGGTYSYDVKLSLKTAGEEAWTNNVALHTDSTFTEHGFVSSTPYKEGFFVSWLDGRNTEEKADGSRGAMTIRGAEISDTGEVHNSTMLDSRACDCCQTTVAITSSGPVVIYRDRSEEEVRDISIVRQVDGAWTEPKRIHQDNWKINGCPVNGPKVAVQGNTLAVAWFTGATEAAVKLAFSTDSGANFDEPILLAGAESIGRVDIELLDEDNAIASWMGSTGENAAIYAMRVGKDGTKGRARIVAELDASRRTGFPQMELLGDTLYFAWTDAGETESVIRCAYAVADTF